MFGVCLECEEHIELEEEIDVEEIVVCPNCKTRHEVLDLDPVVLDEVVETVDSSD
jgi:lysine biosynthesis protein LysW